jgi:hypothetical protein
MHNRYADLNPEKALIFRIIHRDNLPWVMDNGLYCGNSEVKAPDWVNIGNPELISKRAAHTVQTPPGGFLNDYVPFYFTPFSPMLLNIKTGRGGIPKRSNDEIVILVSSLRRVASDANLRWLLRTAMPPTNGPTTTVAWSIWARSTGPSFRPVTSDAPRTIRPSSSATKPRRSSISTCPSAPCWASFATPLF